MNRFPVRLVAAATLASFFGHAQADIVIGAIGDTEVSFDGLLQADGNWYDNDGVNLNGSSDDPFGHSSETGMRRSEINLKGKGARFNWNIGYGTLADRWLDVSLAYKLGSGYLIAGQYKQPQGMEETSSTKNNDFIAKSMLSNTFILSRRVGMGYYADNGKSFGYAVSGFGRELTENLDKGQGYVGRFYYSPIRETGQILHFGISAIDYDTADDQERWRSRPDADLASVRLIDTGVIANADRNRTMGLEGLWVTGPFKVQAEYTNTVTTPTDETTAPDFNADSWYVSGMWNITGETWGYKYGLPRTPLPSDPARGMWQVGIRLDGMNLNDGPVQGGEETNLTLGVNYYWRSNFKVMVNYVAVQSSKYNASLGENVDDNPDIFETRLQFYW